MRREGISTWRATGAVPVPGATTLSAQRNDLSLTWKKDNLYGGNIATMASWEFFVVNSTIYGIYSTLSEFRCDVQRFVRDFAHYNRRKLCAWNTKTNRDFVKKEWPGNHPGCPYLLLLLVTNVVFCSCNSLRQSFVYFIRNYSQLMCCLQWEQRGITSDSVCARRVASSFLVFSLSSHRYSYKSSL